jgi:hypothetical protein
MPLPRSLRRQPSDDTPAKTAPKKTRKPLSPAKRERYKQRQKAVRKRRTIVTIGGVTKLLPENAV